MDKLQRTLASFQINAVCCMPALPSAKCSAPTTVVHNAARNAIHDAVYQENPYASLRRVPTRALVVPAAIAAFSEMGLKWRG